MKPYKKCYIEITNVCNLHCTFCPKTSRPPRMMSEREFTAAVSAVAQFTDYVYLHVMGEPLLHPDLKELLAVAGTAELRVNVTTNGTLLQQAGGVLLSSPAVRKVSISLHSLEANGGIDAEGYLQSVASFCARRDGKIVELRLWNENGAATTGQNLLNGYIQSSLGSRLGVSFAADGAKSGKLAENLYFSRAEKFEWGSGRAGKQSRPAAFCYGLRDQFGVLADGTVIACCLDADGEISLGNLFAAPLADILNSRRARALYEGFSAHTAVEPLCRRCGYAKRFSK